MSFRNKEHINHTINKNKTKEIAKLKKNFQNRTKWSVMKKNQRILLVCWKLTENQSFEISKKQMAEICECSKKYIDNLFINAKEVQRKTKQNLVFENFTTRKKKKERDEFFVPISKKFFISRKPNFNYLDVFLELKDFLTKQEKHTLKSRIENHNQK